MALDDNGAYMVVTEVPFKGSNIAMPSVCNSASYSGYFVSGGKLLSGGTEVTVSPLRNIVKPGTVVPPGGLIGPAVDSATGIEYEIYSMVP